MSDLNPPAEREVVATVAMHALVTKHGMGGAMNARDVAEAAVTLADFLLAELARTERKTGPQEIP